MHRATSVVATLITALALGAPAAAAVGDASPSLTATPSRVAFAKLAPGVTESATTELTNTSDRPMTVVAVTNTAGDLLGAANLKLEIQQCKTPACSGAATIYSGTLASGASAVATEIRLAPAERTWIRMRASLASATQAAQGKRATATITWTGTSVPTPPHPTPTTEQAVTPQPSPTPDIPGETTPPPAAPTTPRPEPTTTPAPTPPAAEPTPDSPTGTTPPASTEQPSPPQNLEREPGPAFTAPPSIAPEVPAGEEKKPNKFVEIVSSVPMPVVIGAAAVGTIAAAVAATAAAQGGLNSGWLFLLLARRRKKKQDEQ